MNVLMIHELRSEYINYLISLDNSVIFTFDDGLFSQYHFFIEYYDILFKHHECIFFISSNIIHNKLDNQILDITSSDAHNIFFDTGDTYPYMTIEQIVQLESYTNVEIGGHGHNHIDISEFSISKMRDYIIKDTYDMIEWFNKNNIKLNSFCFPYNYEHPLYRALILKSINNLYGNTRYNLFDEYDNFVIMCKTHDKGDR